MRASCIRSDTHPICLSLVSVSSLYYTLLVGKVSNGGNMSFFIRIFGAPGSALIKVPIFLPSGLQSRFESSVANIAKLEALSKYITNSEERS